MKKLREWIYTLILYLNASVLFLMFAILLVQVFYRRWLNDPLSWSEEIALLTMVWVTFVGAYQCTAEDGHLKMSFLENILSKKLSIISKIITKIIIIIFVGITAYAGIPLLESSVSRTLPISGITMLVPYLIIWFSIVLMLLETLIQIISELKKLLSRNDAGRSEVTKGGNKL